MAAFGPITVFTDAVEKAIRNEQKAHIDPSILRAVFESDAYAILTELRRQELIATWEKQKAPARPEKPRKKRSASNSETTGSNGAPSAISGASPGTIPKLVHDAAEARASEAVAQILRQKQPGRRSPATTSKPKSPTSRKRQQKPRLQTC